MSEISLRRMRRKSPCRFVLQTLRNGYFAENLAWRGTVNNAIPELAKYVRDTKAQGFVDAANVLEGFLFSKYGLAAGRVSLTSVE